MDSSQYTRPASASVAEIERRTAEHLKICPTLTEYCTACDCSTVVVIRCGFCHSAMWLVPVNGWCEHAEDFGLGEWHRIECGEVPE